MVFFKKQRQNTFSEKIIKTISDLIDHKLTEYNILQEKNSKDIKIQIIELKHQLEDLTLKLKLKDIKDHETFGQITYKLHETIQDHKQK